MKTRLKYGNSTSPKGKISLSKYYTCDIQGHENQPITSICVDKFCSKKGGVCHICVKNLHQSHEVMSYRGFLDAMRLLQREQADKGKHLNRHVSQEDLKDSYQKKLIYISIIENLQKFQKALQEQIFKYEEKLNELFSKYIPDNLVFQQNKHLAPISGWKPNNLQIISNMDYQNIAEHTNDPNKLIDMIDCRIIQNPQTAKAILQKLTEKYIQFTCNSNQYSSQSQFNNQSLQNGFNQNGIPQNNTPTVQLTTLFSNDNPNNINLKNLNTQKQIKDFKQQMQDKRNSLTDLGNLQIEKELTSNDQLEISNKYLYDNLKTHLKKIKITVSEFFQSILVEKPNISSPQNSPPRQQQIDTFKQNSESQSRSNSKNTINPYKTGMWKLHQQAIKDIVSLGKDFIANASQEKNIKIWDLKTGNQTCELEGHEKEVNQLDYFPKLGIIASCSNDKTVKLWKKGSNGKQWSNYATLKGHAESVRSVCFLTQHGILLSGGYDNVIRIWSIQALNQIQSFEQNHVVNCLVELEFNHFLSADGTNINIWELYQKQREPVRVIEAHESIIQQIIYDRQNQLIATASRDSTVKIWNSLSFELIKLLKEDMDVYTVCFIQEQEFQDQKLQVQQEQFKNQGLSTQVKDQEKYIQNKNIRSTRRNSYSGTEGSISINQSNQNTLDDTEKQQKEQNQIQNNRQTPKRKSRYLTPKHQTKLGNEYFYDSEDLKRQNDSQNNSRQNILSDQQQFQQQQLQDEQKQSQKDLQQQSQNSNSITNQKGDVIKLAVGLWSGGQKDEGSMHIWILQEKENRKFKVQGIDNGVTHIIQDLEKEKLISCHIDGKIRIFNKIV
ncbi:WD domain, G-beta repeat protein (macronuclear) [Tetrahymena thermophila SB210]|uniref:WD domain, G-beta repeat protein n=1 Tax=Tetrahymena thermophila (strain SB210) TaxID=312017 RepID=I7MD87_TETTS|nr:WD domain, G-beta repeat protein [Tetrahymena thermophila SB210]EAR85690.2 WD domain, G-beta repeat protein [Tetrahymena thermophila SB210]|eukprot:XP_001033353.2 WD domain, G-beta repeat protein [Tetrahymena thermophila SB210]